jgi:hypothetical protein
MIYLVCFVLTILLVGCMTLALVTAPSVRSHIRARKSAEQRGFALLRSWLTPEQAKQWNSRREFDVIGGDTRKRYRLTRGAVMNIHAFNSANRIVAQWCSAPAGNLATGDVLLAQKIALETLESRALAFANTSALLAPDSW